MGLDALGDRHAKPSLHLLSTITIDSIVPSFALPPVGIGSSSKDWSDHSYDVHILGTTLDLPRHSLEDDIHLRQESALFKQSFVPPIVRQPIINRIVNKAFEAAHGRQRCLTHDIIALSVRHEMNASAGEAPGSPSSLPELTTSKSSKSSKDRTSTASGDGIFSDVTNFEDIGLDEVESKPVWLKPMNGVDIQSRPVPRKAATMMEGHKTSLMTGGTTRNLTEKGRQPPNPTSTEPFSTRPPLHSLGLPHAAPMRKGLRNNSTPSLAIKAMSNYNRSRSPSPNSTSSPSSKQLPSPRSPRFLGSQPPPTQQVPVRRGSWQPSRKPVSELEAEYDDMDDDLPDDASLWNVPLSPRRPSERTVPFSPVLLPPRPSTERAATPPPASSPIISPSTSPERSSPLRTSIGSDGTITSAPKTAPPNVRMTLPATRQSAPVSPRRLLRGISTGMMPDHPDYSRSKSWNMALSELSEEAKSLTKTLENHAIGSETKYESDVQNGNASRMPQLLQARTTSSNQLPPLRVNNIMIDPLPVSKEKEKVLSRTRPSWLPPKSKTEEKRHLREYQRMMECSKELESRKAAKAASTQCAKDDTKSHLLRIWEEHVLPNWDQVIREPRTRELWWRGVAPKSRAQVWQRAIGNDLALTDVTYKKALSRANDIEVKILRNGSADHRREKAWFDAIRRDVKMTFPDLKIFQAGGPMHQGLVDVLTAYSLYRSDVGYSFGTHLIAAFLNLTLPTPSQTFICLANLMNRPLPLAFLTGDPAATGKAYNLTLSLLSKKNPRLHGHLFGSSASSNGAATVTSQPLNFSPAQVLEPLIRTVFLGPGPGLGIDIAARVWDVMVFDGDAAIIRTAVAVLGVLEAKLYGSREEVLAVLGWRGSLGSVGEEEDFMSKIRTVGKVV